MLLFIHKNMTTTTIAKRSIECAILTMQATKKNGELYHHLALKKPCKHNERKNLSKYIKQWAQSKHLLNAA